MAFGDSADDCCQWCGKPLVKKMARQRFHQETCQKAAHSLQVEVSQRLAELGAKLGVVTGEVRRRLRARGCDVCGQHSFTLRGPAKLFPYPSYRVVLDRYLCCPRCTKALLFGSAIDCPPVVLRWILGRFGTRATDTPDAPPLIDREAPRSAP